jgi:hypothetical protein
MIKRKVPPKRPTHRKRSIHSLTDTTLESVCLKKKERNVRRQSARWMCVIILGTL